MRSELPQMTSDETQSLVAAVVSGFGPCYCMSYMQGGLGRVWVERCAGHSFLDEPHRLERLLWIRRTQPFWVGHEHAEKLSDQLQQAIDAALQAAS